MKPNTFRYKLSQFLYAFGYRPKQGSWLYSAEFLAESQWRTGKQ